jgi:hypothetical protein
MKKLSSLIALTTLSAMGFAQYPLKLGPEIGATYNTLNQKINGTKRETNYQFGFRFGGVVDYSFTDNLFLQPGLSLSVNNGTESYGERYYYSGSGLPSSEHDRRIYNITYLQAPVYFLYKTGKEYDDHKFFVGAGPSFNFAVGGRYRQEFTDYLNGKPRIARYDYSLPIGNNSKDDRIRLFDLSANLTAGYEAPFGLFFRLYYGFGLFNVAPGGGSTNVFRNSGGGISIGYLFNTSSKQHWEY